MSIKIGIAPGPWTWTGGSVSFFRFVEACEALGWDSLWLSDRLVSGRAARAAAEARPDGGRAALALPPGPTDLEPVVALAAAVGRTSTLKFGTSVLALPLRNPVVLAKELATIDFLSSGRLFPAAGLGGDDEREYEAAGVRKQERGLRTDEAIGLLRRLWSGDHVTHHGRFFHVSDVTITPRPASPLPIWIGGRSPQAWRRVARLGDGWLASSVTPAEVADGIAAIKAELPTHGREIEPDHYGVMISTYLATSGDAARDRVPLGAGRLRPDVPVESYTAFGPPDVVQERLQAYLAAGASKLVLRLACDEDEALDQLERLAPIAETAAR